MTAFLSHIEYAAEQPPSFLARWTSRIALFCVLLLVAALFLHRIFVLTTPIAVNVALTAFSGAVAVLVMGAISGLDIWLTGRQGTARVVFGSAVALAILAIPFAVWIASRDYPEIADISTDIKNPPEFTELAGRRPEGSNAAGFDQDQAAEIQAKRYPDLKTLVVSRPAEETFELVLQALGKQKLKTLVEESPAAAGDGIGVIELVDTTMILGFKDDVAIRVTGDENEAHVDIRSASQYGKNDFGRNATRIRDILREIVGRLEATATPGGKRPAAVSDGEKGKKGAKSKGIVKRPEAARRPTAAQAKKPDASRSNARRAREPLE